MYSDAIFVTEAAIGCGLSAENQHEHGRQVGERDGREKGDIEDH